MKKHILYILIFNLSVSSISAQEAQFSQFFSNDNIVNPASAGNGSFVKGDMKRQVNRFGLAYRNQWPSLPIGINTIAASFDKGFVNSYGGFGAYVVHDAFLYNSFNSTQLAMQYSYYIPMSSDKIRLRMGLEADAISKSLNINSLRFPDQINNQTGELGATNENLNFRNVQYVDMAIGALLQSSKFELGYSAKNIISPFFSFLATDNVERRLSHTAKICYNFRVGNNDRLPTYLSIKSLIFRQDIFSKLMFGAAYQAPQYSFGIFAQGQKSGSFKYSALTFFAGFQFDEIAVGLSQDVNLGLTKSINSPSSEISLRYFLNQPTDLDEHFQPLFKQIF